MNELIEVGKMAVSAAGGVAGMCVMQWWQRRKNEAETEQLEISAEMARLEFNAKLNKRLAEVENELLAVRTEVLVLKAENAALRGEVSQLQQDKEVGMAKLEDVQRRLNECEERSKAATAP